MNLTPRMLVPRFVCSPDEQTPCCTPGSLEQINPEQQSVSDTQTNPKKQKQKQKIETYCRLNVRMT